MRMIFTPAIAAGNFRKIRKPLFAVLFFFAAISMLSAQTLTELVVPKYFGSKTASTTNNARTPIAVCLQIDGLLPGTAYDIRASIGIITDAPTNWGAGNLWTGTDFSGNIWNNVFITDATGSSGPFWLYLQPTGNGTRFDAGQQHNLRIGYRVNGGAFGSAPNFVGTKIMTALDIANTARTAATTDDGCFVKGSSFPISGGKYVLLFDNELGTGDPLYSYMIRQSIPTQNFSQSELPTLINDVYMQAGTSAIGDYPAVIPIGANNPNGVRRVESRNANNTLFAVNTDPDGIWPSGANTTSPVRRQVVILTNIDTPLNPGGPVPATVVTDPNVTNITFNTATAGGDVTDQGGALVTERGICYGTAINPTIAGPHNVEPGTTGPFTSNIAGLNPNTTYHVRAYATNAAGTSYGDDVTFSTLCEPYAPVPEFWADKLEIMVGDTVNFSDSTQYCPDTWNWSFVGGIPMTSNQQNPQGIVYNYPGEFNVCLTVTNGYGTQTLCKDAYIKVTEPLDAHVVITEISYNPPESGNDSLEFIELYNNDTDPVDLENFYFDAGVVFTFPSYILNPGAYLLVSVNDTAMLNTFGVPSLQWTSGALSNSGELILLKDRFGVTVDSVNYDDVAPWDSLADGRGPSLELCDPNVDNSLGQNWRAAIEFAAVNANGDSIFASPLAGCSYPPVAGFFAEDTAIFVNEFVTFTNTSTGNPTGYHWVFQGGEPATYDGATPPPIQYTAMGSYDVSLTVSNIAGSHTLVRPGYITVGVDAVPGYAGGMFSIYPNPAVKGSFTLRFGQGGTYDISILSSVGTTVYTARTSAQSLKMSLPELPAGIYMVRVTGEDSSATTIQKLIVQ